MISRLRSTSISRFPCKSCIQALSTSTETQMQKMHRIADDLLSLNKLERHDYAILFKHKMRSNRSGLGNSGVVSASGPSVAGPKLVFDRFGPAFFETVSSSGTSVSGGEAAAGAADVEPAEKTAFDVKLEKFDAAAKIKVIKEVRGFTSLGLKEAKDLVEKTPVVLKKGVTKEEAEAIMEKLKDFQTSPVEHRKCFGLPHLSYKSAREIIFA